MRRSALSLSSLSATYVSTDLPQTAQSAIGNDASRSERRGVGIEFTLHDCAGEIRCLQKVICLGPTEFQSFSEVRLDSVREAAAHNLTNHQSHTYQSRSPTDYRRMPDRRLTARTHRSGTRTSSIRIRVRSTHRI